MYSFDILQLKPLIPELFLAVIAMGLLMLGAFRATRAIKAVHYAAIISCALAIYLIALIPMQPQVLLHGMFVIDGFIHVSKCLVLLGALLVLLLSTQWQMREENGRFEFSILILLSTLGLLLLISAGDLMALYMGLELSSLSLYVLASFQRDSLKSTEAGLKYFVLGALASGMMLFGASLIYGFTGTTSFAALGALWKAADPLNTPLQVTTLLTSPGVLVGLVLIIVGLCFKISAVPFHMWTPDVYEGAPTPVTAFFAVAPKIAAVTLFTRLLMVPFGDLIVYWQQVIIFISIASMVIGALGALRQTNIKRLLAYSSIGHVGYILIGIAAGSEAGVSALLLYLTLYLFMSVGAFSCVLLLQRQGEYVENIAELSGLYQTRPLFAFALAAFMFSMAGIPPLAGFFGKMYVFLAAVEAQLYVLAVIGVLTSVIACYYYLKIVKLMFLDEAREPFDGNRSAALRYVLIVSSLVTLFFFLFPTPLVSYAKIAAQSLFL